ncbi:MAG: hypothetical protein V4709_10685 [Pseudomonadota bacterium]
MNRFFSIAVVSASLILSQLSACVAAPVTEEPASTTAAAAPADENAAGIECETIETTGSRVRRQKICRTAAEREQSAEAGRAFVDGVNRGNSNQPGGESLGR